MKSRRKFFGAVAGSAAMAALGKTAHAESLAHPAPVDDAWDTTWADRVNGKFRAVFDSPSISDGAGLFRALFWIDNYKTVYATDRKEMSAVIVFRHSAIPLVMNDEYWKTYGVGKEAKMKAPNSKKWAEANPIRSTPPGMPAQYASYSLEHFLANGGTVLACNLAFGEVVANVMKREKLDAKAARPRAISLLIPGVILQPSGVFAVLRAQEAGCKYILATEA